MINFFALYWCLCVSIYFILLLFHKPTVKNVNVGERREIQPPGLSPLAILQMHKHKNVDTDSVVTEFACLNGRRLALIFGDLYLLHGVTVYPFFAVSTVLYRQQ